MKTTAIYYLFDVLVKYLLNNNTIFRSCNSATNGHAATFHATSKNRLILFVNCVLYYKTRSTSRTNDKWVYFGKCHIKYVSAILIMCNIFSKSLVYVCRK